MSPRAQSTTSMSLSERINASTRTEHTQLNSLILSIFPYCLPPHATTPTLYAKGIFHIVPIYEAFEGAIETLHSNGRPYLRPELLEGLKALCLPGLERAAKAREDTKKLLINTSDRLDQEGSSTSTTRNDSSPGPVLEAFLQHIHASTVENPHLLLAYTWVLYMALFSGGRYLRAKLRQAGPAFWNAGQMAQSSGGQTDVDQYLGIWTFPGEKDGVDIKTEYKSRFNEIEASLTETEKEEVVREAVYVMGTMTAVVQEILDTIDEKAKISKNLPSEHHQQQRKTDTELVAEAESELDKAQRLAEKQQQQAPTIDPEPDTENTTAETQKADSIGTWCILPKHITFMSFVQLISGVSKALGAVFKTLYEGALYEEVKSWTYGGREVRDR